MSMELPLRSTQSSLLLSLSNSFDAVTHAPVMPLQHLSQLPSEPARQSARVLADALAVAPSQVWPLGQAVHTLLRTYLMESHTVAAAPSQVKPLGQAVHALSSRIGRRTRRGSGEERQLKTARPGS